MLINEYNDFYILCSMIFFIKINILHFQFVFILLIEHLLTSPINLTMFMFYGNDSYLERLIPFYVRLN